MKWMQQFTVTKKLLLFILTLYIQRLWSVGPRNCLTDAYEYTWALCLIDRCEWALSAGLFRLI